MPVKEATSIKKLPPQNLEAESAVLGSILMNSNGLNRVVEIFLSQYNDILI